MIEEITKLTLTQYIYTYRKDIRVLIDWKSLKLSSLKTDFVILDSKNDDIIYHCWSENDQLMGPRKKVDVKYENPIIIRIPGVKYKNKIVLLDGNHRISELHPKIVIVDYIQCDEKNKRIFVDLL